MVSFCPFQVETNAKSEEMALETEPKLDLRKKHAAWFHAMQKYHHYN